MQNAGEEREYGKADGRPYIADTHPAALPLSASAANFLARGAPLQVREAQG